MTIAARPAVYAKLVAVALIWGGSFIAARVVAVEMAAPTAALWRYLIATTALLGLSFALERGLPRRARAGLAFLGLFGTALAYIWFYDGVQMIGPARSAVFVNLVPIAAIALAVLLLGERLARSMIVGGSLVVAGVFVINWPVRAEAAPAVAVADSP